MSILGLMDLLVGARRTNPPSSNGKISHRKNHPALNGVNGAHKDRATLSHKAKPTQASKPPSTFGRFLNWIGVGKPPIKALNGKPKDKPKDKPPETGPIKLDYYKKINDSNGVRTYRFFDPRDQERKIVRRVLIIPKKALQIDALIQGRDDAYLKKLEQVEHVKIVIEQNGEISKAEQVNVNGKTIDITARHKSLGRLVSETFSLEPEAKNEDVIHSVSLNTMWVTSRQTTTSAKLVTI